MNKCVLTSAYMKHPESNHDQPPDTVCHVTDICSQGWGTMGTAVNVRKFRIRQTNQSRLVATWLWNNKPCQAIDNPCVHMVTLLQGRKSSCVPPKNTNGAPEVRFVWQHKGKSSSVQQKKKSRRTKEMMWSEMCFF